MITSWNACEGLVSIGIGDDGLFVLLEREIVDFMFLLVLLNLVVILQCRV